MEISIQKNTIVGQVPVDDMMNQPHGRRVNSVNINITSSFGDEVNRAEAVILSALQEAGMIVLPTQEDDDDES
jgi:hypothetical protein